MGPRNLICQICGRSYHVDNYDPDTPSAFMCLECFQAGIGGGWEELEARE